MGMTNCPDCGKEISDMAQNCPNCGRPMQLNMYGGTPLPQRTKKRGNGCFITFFIMVAIFICFCVIMTKGIEDMKENPSKYDDSIAAKYIDISSEESFQIDKVLNDCGISSVIAFEHDELLDNAHFDGETGYRLAVNRNINNVTVYLTADMTVYNVRYADYDLFLDGMVVGTLQDYTFEADEKTDLMVSCEEKVKEILKSPSTAKFPDITEWGFKKEKNIITIQGFVDSQNGFGAEIRSIFQFIINTDTDTIQSLIFDGQEMIQQ